MYFEQNIISTSSSVTIVKILSILWMNHTTDVSYNGKLMNKDPATIIVAGFLMFNSYRENRKSGLRSSGWKNSIMISKKSINRQCYQNSDSKQQD